MNNTLEKIGALKLIAVLRHNNENELSLAFDKIVEGGITALEIAQNCPFALNLLEKKVKQYENTNVIIGAGTVLDENVCERVISAGAKFILTPAFSSEVVLTAQKHNVAVIPGVFTPSEILQANKLGVNTVKLFPSTAYKPTIIKDLSAPFENLKIIPSAGINFENAKLWLEAGAFALAVSSPLLEGIKLGEYETIVKNAYKFNKLVSSSIL